VDQKNYNSISIPVVSGNIILHHVRDVIKVDIIFS